MKIKDLKLHKVVELLPEMLEPEYIMLKTDIKMFGIKEPLSVIGNEIIDGRHRFRVAKELNLKEVPTIEIDISKDNIESYVISLNLKRRHLNPGQKALLAIEVYENGGTGAPQIKNSTNRASTVKRNKLNITKLIADLAGVGVSTVEYVQYVRKNGTENDIRTLRSGSETVKSIMQRIKKKLKSTTVTKPKTTKKDSSNIITTTKEQELEDKVLSLTEQLGSIQEKELDKKIQYINKHGSDIQCQAASYRKHDVVNKLYELVHNTYTTKGMNPSFPPPMNKISSTVENKDYDELKVRFDNLNKDYDKLLDKCIELENIIADGGQKYEKVKDYTQLHGSDITPEELDNVKLVFSDHDTYKRLMTEYQKVQNSN